MKYVSYFYVDNFTISRILNPVFRGNYLKFIEFNEIQIIGTVAATVHWRRFLKKGSRALAERYNLMLIFLYNLNKKTINHETAAGFQRLALKTRRLIRKKHASRMCVHLDCGAANLNLS